MDAIIRSIAIYAFLLVLFRLSGKRALSQITTFDFVLLLIIGEATQQALLGDDFSIINAFIVITTLLAFDVFLSLLKQRSQQVGKLVDGVPLIIAEDGKLIQDRMSRARIDKSDVLSAARRMQGLENLEQIKFAVLERDGTITIIPSQSGGG